MRHHQFLAITLILPLALVSGGCFGGKKSDRVEELEHKVAQLSASVEALKAERVKTQGIEDLVEKRVGDRLGSLSPADTSAIDEVASSLLDSELATLREHPEDSEGVSAAIKAAVGRLAQPAISRILSSPEFQQTINEAAQEAVASLATDLPEDALTGAQEKVTEQVRSRFVQQAATPSEALRQRLDRIAEERVLTAAIAVSDKLEDYRDTNSSVELAVSRLISAVATDPGPELRVRLDRVIHDFLVERTRTYLESLDTEGPDSFRAQVSDRVDRVIAELRKGHFAALDPTIVEVLADYISLILSDGCATGTSADEDTPCKQVEAEVLEKLLDLVHAPTPPIRMALENRATELVREVADGECRDEDRDSEVRKALAAKLSLAIAAQPTKQGN